MVGLCCVAISCAFSFPIPFKDVYIALATPCHKAKKNMILHGEQMSEKEDFRVSQDSCSDYLSDLPLFEAKHLQQHGTLERIVRHAQGVYTRGESGLQPRHDC
jgi:hypothetical protein